MLCTSACDRLNLCHFSFAIVTVSVLQWLHTTINTIKCMGMEMQECHSPEEFKPLLLAFRKNDWKVEGMESAVPFHFPVPLVASQGYVTEWLQYPGWHLGVHKPFYTQGMALAVMPPSWTYDWQNGCGGFIYDQPPGDALPGTVRMRDSHETFVFIEVSWQWQQRWYAACSKIKGWEARLPPFKLKSIQQRGMHTHSHVLV